MSRIDPLDSAPLVVEEHEAKAEASPDQLSVAESILARLLVRRWQAARNSAEHALDLSGGGCPDLSDGSKRSMQERADQK